MLSDISKLFDQEVLNELRCEAGGIQTVLRNCHQVFRGKSTKVTSLGYVQQFRQFNPFIYFYSSKWDGANTRLAR